MTGYFVAPDAHDDEWVWQANGDYPIPVLALRPVPDDLRAAIVELVEGDA